MEEDRKRKEDALNTTTPSDTPVLTTPPTAAASSGPGKIAASGASNGEVLNEDQNSMDVDDVGDKPAGSSEVGGC